MDNVCRMFHEINHFGDPFTEIPTTRTTSGKPKPVVSPAKGPSVGQMQQTEPYKMDHRCPKFPSIG